MLRLSGAKTLRNPEEGGGWGGGERRGTLGTNLLVPIPDQNALLS